MTDDLVIIDESNPFVPKKRKSEVKGWVEQRRPLTEHRKDQLEKLWNLNIESIKNQSEFDAPYVAFTAIRWGFAIINKEGKLEETDIWRDKDIHDDRGKKIDKSVTISNSKHPQKRIVTSKRPFKLPSAMQRDDLIRELRIFQVEPIIERYLAKDHLVGKTVGEILVFSFDNTISRAFRNETPTSRYKKWRWNSNPNELCEQLNALNCQEDYDRFEINLAESLVNDWGKFNDLGGPTRMNIGIALKIINLVLKHMVLSKHTSNSNLKKWLHVPWDKYTLNAVHIIYQGCPPIPKNPSQGFVESLDIYLKLHALISEITQTAGIDRINFEIWAWDASHS